MKSFFLLLIPLVALAAADHGHDHGAHGAHDEHEEPSEVRLAPAVATAFGVAVEPARKRPLADLIIAPGAVDYDPDARAVVVSPLAGRVVALPVARGATVAVGDALAEISSPAWVAAQNALLLARAARERADLVADQAAKAVARAGAAGDGLAGSERQRREADAAHAGVAARAAAAEAAAARAVVVAYADEAAAVRLERGEPASATLTLRAPLAGQVIARPATLGQEANGELAVIADPTRLRVLAGVPASALARVTPGSLAELVDGAGLVLSDGDVLQVLPEIDEHTRTGTARIQPASTAALRPGMRLEVRITPLSAEAVADLVTVPEAAVVLREGAAMVFVSDGKGAYAPRTVQVGPTMGGFVPVLAGLRVGESVVVAAAFLLKADLGKSEAAHEH